MLTRGNSVFIPVFSSRLAPVFSRYVDLKRALGRRFDIPSRTLQSLDWFLHEEWAKYACTQAAGSRRCPTEGCRCRFSIGCHSHSAVMLRLSRRASLCWPGSWFQGRAAQQDDRCYYSSEGEPQLLRLAMDAECWCGLTERKNGDVTVGERGRSTGEVHPASLWIRTSGAIDAHLVSKGLQRVDSRRRYLLVS